MSEREAIVDSGGIPLFLRRLPQPERDAEVVPVLLLHGASARHETFTIPGPDARGRPRSLAGWLHEQGFEPWLLDWRGSGRVVDAIGAAELARLRDRFDLDQAAGQDLPAALGAILARRPGSPRIAVVGHCLGAALLAQAIASGAVGAGQRVSHVVLLTLGLFYELPLDSRLKAQDRLLERHLDRRRGVSGIDPRKGGDWPPQLRELYHNWPLPLRPHGAGPVSEVEELCDRLSFMYGTPYYEPNLVPEIHGDGSGAAAELPGQFGQIPLRLYAHGARNARRGWAAAFGAEDDPRLALFGDASRAAFDRLERLTLITGQNNQLWHRDSIDRMYEWLTRGRGRRRARVHKHVVSGYGHQDLLWGRRAREDVFPRILAGLRPAVPALRAPESPAGRRPPAPQPPLDRPRD